jgi:hypothetical protein
LYIDKRWVGRVPASNKFGEALISRVHVSSESLWVVHVRK